MTAYPPFLLAAGLCGAAGIALSAAAAHIGGGTVATAASFLLAHAPAFLALALLGGGSRAPRWSGWVLLAGLGLFCGDLLMRHFVGTRLFPMAAPTGGMLMILGWLAVGVSGYLGRRESGA